MLKKFQITCVRNITKKKKNTFLCILVNLKFKFILLKFKW